MGLHDMLLPQTFPGLFSKDFGGKAGPHHHIFRVSSQPVPCAKTQEGQREMLLGGGRSTWRQLITIQCHDVGSVASSASSPIFS